MNTAFNPWEDTIDGPLPTTPPSADFKKYDSHKPRYSLLPLNALQSTVAVLEFGAQKYGPNNWSLCSDPIRYYDAAMRHLIAFKSGELLDPESGHPHLSHAICSLMFLSELTKD